MVFLRQQERQWARERERSEELQSTTEAHYTAQLQHLQHQLQAVEKERNICMVCHLLLKLDVSCSYSHPHAVEKRNICMVCHLLLKFDVPCSYSHPHAVEKRNICMVCHLLLKFDVPCSYSHPHAVEKERNICMVCHLLLKFDVPCSYSHPHAVEKERNICMVCHLLLKFDVPCSYSHPHAMEKEQNICMVCHLLLEFDVVWIFTLGSINICAHIKIPWHWQPYPLLGHRNTAHAGKNGWCCSCWRCAVPRYGGPNFPQGVNEFVFCWLFYCPNSSIYIYSECYVLKWILNMRVLKYV